MISVGVGTASAVGVVTLSETLNMNNNQIKNVQIPTDPQDAATKEYVDTTAILPPSTQTQIDNIETETDKIQMVKNDVTNIKTTVNNFDKSFSQVKSKSVFSSSTLSDKIQCSSNKDFVVHVFLKLSSTSSYSLGFPGIGTTMSTTHGVLHSYTVGGTTSGIVRVDTTSSSGIIVGQLVLQTTSDAIASCADVP